MTFTEAFVTAVAAACVTLDRETNRHLAGPVTMWAWNFAGDVPKRDIGEMCEAVNDLVLWQYGKGPQPSWVRIPKMTTTTSGGGA